MSDRELRLVLYVSVGFSIVMAVIVVAITLYFAHPFPTHDEWQLSQYIAVRAASDELTFSDLFVVYGVHRHVPSNIVTALSVYFTQWHIPSVMLVNPFLAILNFIVLARFSWKISPVWSPVFIVTAATLVFAPGQLETWIIPIHSSWLFAALFVSSVAYIIAYFPITKWMVSLLMLLCILATFSIGTAIVIWGVVLVALFLRNVHDLKVYLSVIVIALVSMGLYLSDYAGEIESQADLFPYYASADFTPGPAVFFKQTAYSIGGNILPLPATPTAVIGMVTIAVVIALFLWLWIDQRETRSILAGVAVIAMYGIGGTAFIMLGRAEEVRAAGILFVRYEVTSMYTFLALFMLIVLAMTHKAPSQQIIQFMIVPCLIIFVSVDLFFDFARLRSGGAYFEGFYTINPCLESYPLTRDVDCFIQGETALASHRQPEFIFQLAAYGLSGFQNHNPEKILSIQTVENSPVIILSHSIWLNLYVREYLFDLIAEEHIVHIAPPPQWTDPTAFPDPPRNWLFGCDYTQITELENADAVWLVVAEEMVDAQENFCLNLEGYGYDLISISPPVQHQAAFVIYHYERR